MLFGADTVFEEVVPKSKTAAVEDIGVSGPKENTLFDGAGFDDPKSVPKSNEVLFVEIVPFDFALLVNGSAFAAVPNTPSLAGADLTSKFSMLPDLANGSLSAPDELMNPLLFVEELLAKSKGSFAPKLKGPFASSLCAVDVEVPKTLESIEKSFNELLVVAKPLLPKDITESCVPVAKDMADLEFLF